MQSGRFILFQSMIHLRRMMLLLASILPVYPFPDVATGQHAQIGLADSLPRPLSIRIDQLLEAELEQRDDGWLAEELDRMLKQPLDINRATHEELSSLPLITPEAAAEILRFRQAAGRIHHLSELRSIETLRGDPYQILDIFTVVDDARLTDYLRSISGSVRLRMKTETSVRKGYTNGRYAGDPWSQLSRILATDGDHFSMGVLMEKDMGEPSIADHATGYLMCEDLLFPGRIILGNFTFSSPQGILSGTGRGFSKGGDVINASRRRGSILKPAASSTENGTFLGIGFESRFGGAILSGIISRSPLDASFDSTGAIISFPSSGLHRTPSEIESKEGALENSMGGRIAFRYQSGHLSIVNGLSGLFSRFSHPLARSQNPAGPADRSALIGYDFDVLLPGFHLFGEWVCTADRSIGGMSGFTASLGSDARISLSVHSFPRRFSSVHGRSVITDDGIPSNTQQLYCGMEFRPAKGERISFYYDHVRKPGGSSQIGFPVAGGEFFCSYATRIRRGIDCELRFRRSTRDEWTVDETDGVPTRVMLSRTNTNIRMQWDFRTGRDTRFRFRVEHTDVRYERSKSRQEGLLFFVDTGLRPLPWLWIEARAVLFRTTAFESRVYEFENDVPGDLSNPALSGQGSRSYCLLRFEPFDSIRLSAKYACTTREDISMIGSGDDIVFSDSLGKLSLQVDVKW